MPLDGFRSPGKSSCTALSFFRAVVSFRSAVAGAGAGAASTVRSITNGLSDGVESPRITRCRVVCGGSVVSGCLKIATVSLTIGSTSLEGLVLIYGRYFKAKGFDGCWASIVTETHKSANTLIDRNMATNLEQVSVPELYI